MASFCCVLRQFGGVLLRSALIWCRFAAFCINLVPFCRVLQRFGLVLLRSATIWCPFAAFCINLGPFCCVLQRFGVRLLRSASPCISMLLPRFGLGQLIRGSRRCHQQLCALRFEHDFGTAADHQTSLLWGGGMMCLCHEPRHSVLLLPGHRLFW